MQTFSLAHLTGAATSSSQNVTSNITQIDGRNVANLSTAGLSVAFERKKDDIDAQIAEFMLDNLKKGIQSVSVRGCGPRQ